jgi:uncharacterized protein involved in exopolysaccharide biosynthesis
MVDEFSSDRYADDQPSVDVGELLLYAVGRYRYQIGLFVFVGAALAFLVAASQPNVYESFGKVLVKHGTRENLSAEDTGNPVRGGSMTAVQDELHLLRDPALVDDVVALVGADAILASPDPAAQDDEGTPFLARSLHSLQSWWFGRGAPVVHDPKSPQAVQAAVATVSANVTVGNERNSSVISVLYAAPSPQLAQAVVDAFLEVFEKRHTEAYKIDAQLEVMTNRYSEALDDWEATKGLYELHRRGCGVFNIETDRDNLTEDILDYRDERARNELALKNIEGRLSQLEEQLEATSPHINQVSAGGGGVLNSKRKRLLDERDELERSLAVYQRMYKEGSQTYEQLVVPLRRDLDAVKLELAKEPEVLEAGEGTTIKVPNPQYESLVRDRFILEQTRRGLTASAGNVDRLIEEREARLREVNKCESNHSSFELEVALKRDRVLEAKRALANRQDLSELEQNERLANLKVIQRANLPMGKSAPDRGKLIVMGILGAGGLGFLLAVIRQFADSRVRYPKKVEKELGIRVLGVVVEEPRYRRFGKRMRRLALRT